MPIVGFMMRNHQGIDFSGTNTAREEYELPAMTAGDILTVDFHLDLPELYPGSFSFSPALADGTLMTYKMCDWIDNAITCQMANSEGQVYGYLRMPCRVRSECAVVGEEGRGSRSRSLILPEAFHAEFTGERVIPGRVEENLFNEHLSRYRFSARLLAEARGAGRVLDAGCGTALRDGAELAQSRAWKVLGIDVSEEAIVHARANYATASNIRFEQASCTAIPAEDGAFRMIAAFEVIEHLEDWRGFLREAYRVLGDDGMFLVSTPNRLYYAESRQKAGPNPFHVHEFTEEEFRSELELVFPQVKMLAQNHVEGIAFFGCGCGGRGAGDRRTQGRRGRGEFFPGGVRQAAAAADREFRFLSRTAGMFCRRVNGTSMRCSREVFSRRTNGSEREQAERGGRCWRKFRGDGSRTGGAQPVGAAGERRSGTAGPNGGRAASGIAEEQ